MTRMSIEWPSTPIETIPFGGLIAGDIFHTGSSKVVYLKTANKKLIHDGEDNFFYTNAVSLIRGTHKSISNGAVCTPVVAVLKIIEEGV